MHCRGLQFLILTLLTVGCSAAREEARIAQMIAPAPSVQSFDVCHGSGCAVRTPTSLTPEEWSRIATLFGTGAPTAAEERARIAGAVGLFETIVGPRTGTSADQGRNRRDTDQSRQLDCIDESVNTTTYLRLIDQAGLLRWHEVGLPAHREAEFLDFHNSAVIVDRIDGSRWAVDSWFARNGVPPFIVPLEDWIAGWQPGQRLAATAATNEGDGGTQP